MKTTIFCGLIAACLLAGSAIPGSAQNKRWEHNLYEGVGMAKNLTATTTRQSRFMWATASTTTSPPSGLSCLAWLFEPKLSVTIVNIRGTVHRPISMFPCSHNTILAARSVRA